MPARSTPLPVAARPEEAAKLFGYTRTKVYELLRAGTIRAKQSGRATLVVIEDLQRHFDSLPDRQNGGDRTQAAQQRRAKRS